MADKQKQTHNWKDRAKAAFAAFERRLAARPTLFTICLLAVCALVIMLRKPEAFTHAQFWAEDGVLWFQDAYNKGFWGTVFLPYSGTFSMFHRTVGYISTVLPLAFAPLFFSLIALGCQLLPVFIFASKRMLPIVKYRLIGVVVSLVYVAVTNSSEVFVNLANVQWHLGVAAFLVLIIGKPTGRLWVAFDVVVLALLGISGPLTFPLVFIALIIWLKSRKDRSALLHLGVLMATSLLQAISMFIIEPAQRGGGYVIAWVDMARMVSGQIFTGSILGAKHVDYFYYSHMLYVVLAAGLGIIAYALWKGPSWLKYANLYALMVFVAMLASLKPLVGVDVWGILTHHDTGQRYWYIPILVWLATLLWIVFAAKSLIMRTLSGCLILLFICIGVPGSWDIPPMPDRNYRQYVDTFNTLKKGSPFAIPTNPDPWMILLRKH
jgi:hypothetical protein